MLAKAAKENPSLGDVSFHIVGLPVCTVSVFGKKSDAVCGFLAYFCAVLRFTDPPYTPLFGILLHLGRSVSIVYLNRIYPEIDKGK